MNKITEFIKEKKRLESKYPGYTFETDIVNLIPSDQKVCTGCRKLIVDLRDHFTCKSGEKEMI